ncbi:MAG TPA: hypothetical protein VGG28_33665 [Kofleriaceae bacterium]|jgi:hypothetical protein
MGALRTVVMSVVLVGCFPPPPPQDPQQPPPQPYVQPQPYVTPATPPPQQVAPTDPYAPQQPQQPQQPPQAQPQPYAQPAPPPYPPPQSYPPPYYAQPPPQYYAGPPPRTHLHDGEVIADFVALGTLAAIDIIARQDIENGEAGTFIVLAGVVGGGGLGYLLTQRFPVDSSVAHATTIGTLVGMANGALLIQPTGADTGTSVVSLLLAGGAVGAAGGFIYGENANLTPGQATFMTNLTVLGTVTALNVIAAKDNFDGWSDATLAIGIDGGLIAGALIAPHLNWSSHRAGIVFATSFVGGLVGALVGGLATKPSDGGASDANASVVTGIATAGMWGGFGLGILMTRDDPPPLQAQPAQPAQLPTTMLPFVGDHGQLGMAMGGTF